MSIPIHERPRYRPSGRVHWIALLISLLPVIAIAILVAMGLGFALVHGFYFVIWMPCIAGALVGGAVWWAVGNGKCRSPRLAGAIGGIVGIFTYLAIYHYLLVTVGGWRCAHRVDLLPQVISAHVENQVVRDVRRGNQGGEPNSYLNWLRFALGGFLISLIPAIIAAPRAKRLFNEQNGQWGQRRRFTLPGGTGLRAWQAIQEHDLPDLRRLATTPVEPKKGVCELTLESFIPLDQIGPQDGLFLTITDRQQTYSRSEQQLLKDLRQFALTPDEASTVLRVLISKTVADEWPSTILSAETRGITGQLAERIAVDEPNRGRVLSRRNVILGSCVAFIPLLVPIVATGLAYGVAKTFAHGDGNSVSGIVAVIVLFVTLPAALYMLRYFGDLLPSLLLRRQAQRHFALRADAIVAIDDPQAIFVQIIPRDNWKRLMLENASDVGFFKIDSQRSEIRFEGDAERYVIPLGAIADCFVEQFVLPGDSAGNNQFSQTILLANTAEGLWEISLSHRHVTREKRGPRERLEWATQLMEAINAARRSARPDQ